ncbi:aspartyl protease family protein At5g10770-like isoform X2 [Phragmites australis]|uniref:aspartyl protease family protein At5g10770-like isoform X2 n=1 Tax=Phragmites australis TaxID=29695 RepID=UPI002D79B7BC|nr:aspartyl protease family protein At5g10770-like isoform X2 [Phragmites australis]
MHTVTESKLASHMVFVLAPLLLLLLSGGSSSPVVRAAADHGDDDYMMVAMSSLKAKAACFGHRVIPPDNGTWVPLNRPRGPCSPSLSGAAKPLSLADLLRQDQLRVDDIQWRLSDDVRDNKGSVKPPMMTASDQINHQATAQVIVGSESLPNSSMEQGSQVSIDPAATGRRSSLPGVVQTVVLDTASDVPWVQCVPCPVPPCHPQTDTFYDPSRSGTYAAFPCNSPACTRLGPYANGCVNNQCQYRVRYPDGSSSSGTYSSDLLTFNPTNAISNFQFGCSHAVQGSFDSRTAGIMALGGGPESLVSQTASTYGNAFSYCLPPTESYKGFFVLGVPRVAASRYVVTPMLRYKQVPTFYRVLLQAITVAGQQLNVPRAVFAAGSVLDSRTVITRLPPTAYQALRAAFMNKMSMYRAAPPKGNLDTCYDFTGVANVRLPRISLVFDKNAVVEIDPSAVLFNDCLAFIPNRDDRMPGILGNLQQQTIEVLYDVGNGAVGFRRNAC